ncbi:hypothetical protein Afil01_21690 [Actinorhabdospora filicis]|uniref:Uncharacterized protein n=1 Tax=Actinorhabdospora filicis TaxID=1785913 RepID=A0A9W6W2T1_9ACTN|nr:hypothetical protein Afil01_21690 [Actinorhabdospora filicis]
MFGHLVGGFGRGRFERPAAEIGYGYGYAVVIGDHLDIEVGAGVYDAVGGQLGGEEHRLVEQVGEAGRDEDLSDERTRRRRRLMVGR